MQSLGVVIAKGESETFIAHRAARADSASCTVRRTLTGKPVDLRVLATQGVGMPPRTMDELVEGPPGPDQLRQAGHRAIVTIRT
jgi:hypothetical protein